MRDERLSHAGSYFARKTGVRGLTHYLNCVAASYGLHDGEKGPCQPCKVRYAIIAQFRMPASVFLHSLGRLLPLDDLPPLSTQRYSSLPWNRNFASGAGLPSALMHDPSPATARPCFDRTSGAVIPFSWQKSVV